MIRKVSENTWEIEKEGKMNVKGIVFASDILFENIKKDNKTLDQVRNVASLPGIVEKSIAMPDAHQGYGFCIGGVAAFDSEKGIISPGGVGYDINCGVRLLASNISTQTCCSSGVPSAPMRTGTPAAASIASAAFKSVAFPTQF